MLLKLNQSSRQFLSQHISIVSHHCSKVLLNILTTSMVPLPTWIRATSPCCSPSPIANSLIFVMLNASPHCHVTHTSTFTALSMSSLEVVIMHASSANISSIKVILQVNLVSLSLISFPRHLYSISTPTCQHCSHHCSRTRLKFRLNSVGAIVHTVKSGV